MSTAFKNRRDAAKTDYEQYSLDSVTAGTHDQTVALRDREALYYSLLGYASTVGASVGEKQSRSYGGYEQVVRELIHDEKSTSVDDTIVASLLQQNTAFQKQVWTQQQTTFDERQQRWMEEVGYIRTRGERDWMGQMSSFYNEWLRWKVSTRDQITEGEKEWGTAAVTLNRKMESWQKDTSERTADASVQMLYEQVDAMISDSVNTINKNLPKTAKLDFDTDRILQDAMKGLPQATIGVLADGMNTVNTTAGFTTLLNLGLTTTLQARYEEQMSQFENSVKVMQNLRMSEVLDSILAQFGEQLKVANRSSFDAVMTGIARSYYAPFMRGDNRQWSIRVVEDHTLVKTSYRTIRFDDYADYINTTVALKSLKGIDGGSVDFSRPETYRSLDARDLEVYVRLESTMLNKEIQSVLGPGGSFSTHTDSEFARLNTKFSDAYMEYMAGQSLMGMSWYMSPVAPGVPVNTLTLAKVVGSIAITCSPLGPWGAFAYNSMFTAIEAKQGGMSWKQAGAQIAVNAAITAATAGAGSAVGSAMGNGQSFATQVAVAGTRAFVQTAGNTVASCIQYDEGGGLSWNQDKFTDNKTWSQAGLSFATSFAGSVAAAGLKEMQINSNLASTTFTTSINTMGSNVRVSGSGGWHWQGWGNIDGDKAVIDGTASWASSTATGNMRDQYVQAFSSSLISSYVKAGTASLFERYGGADYGDTYSLNKAITVDTLGVSVNQAYERTLNTVVNSSLPDKDRKRVEDPRSVLQMIGDGFGAAGKDILSMGTGIVNEIKNIVGDASRIGNAVVAGVQSIGRGMANLGQMVKNTFEYGEFATDDSDVVRRARQLEESRRMWADGTMDEWKRTNSKFVGEGPLSYRKIIGNFERLSNEYKTIDKTVNNSKISSAIESMVAKSNNSNYRYNEDFSGKREYFAWIYENTKDSSDVIIKESGIPHAIYDGRIGDWRIGIIKAEYEPDVITKNGMDYNKIGSIHTHPNQNERNITPSTDDTTPQPMGPGLKSYKVFIIAGNDKSVYMQYNSGNPYYLKKTKNGFK